jgi:hypothetical protein
MKKNIIISILILINIIFIILLINNLTFQNNNLKNVGIDNEFDIIEHSKEYRLLYSLNLRNSLAPKCNWGDLSYKWNFPKENILKIYESSNEVYELPEKDPDSQVVLSDSIKESIENFYKDFPELGDILKSDYEVEIYSSEQTTSEKIPLYLTNNNLKILISTLGIWRNNESKYAAGLYESSNSFRQPIFDIHNTYSTFEAKNEEKIKEEIQKFNMEFLNHEYLCENVDIKETTIDSIELIYINLGEYIFPVYKIIGEFNILDNLIKWTALVNPIDYTKLDYTIYEDQKTEITFIPKPFITSITYKDDEYLINGMLPNKKGTNDSEIADKYEIDFSTVEKTGEYVFGERKKSLIYEINKSLKVNENGEFTFQFSNENFWMVEKVIYNNEESSHSRNAETERNIYDNWFTIQVCSIFNSQRYCGESSNIYYLNK